MLDSSTHRSANPSKEGVPRREQRLRILHLIVSLGHSNSQFNEHCLPRRFERDISICSFTPATVEVPPEITVFEGDGTVRGFALALRRALAAKDYDIVHAHAPGTGALLMVTALVRRRSLPNAVLTIHNSRRSFDLRSQLVLLPLLVTFPTVVFCSRAARESFSGILRLIRRRPFYVVQNGVDLERIGRVLAAAPVSAAPAGNGFVVGSVGRLIDRKDPIALLHAFTMAAGEDDRLVYVGDGPDRAGLLEEARRANAESRVVVTGLLARDEVYRHLLGMDLVVSASHAEGLPVAVLEAMACSRPVVISDIPSHREIADQTKFIPLVSPGDLAGLSWEIARFRAMKPRERRQIGARCRQLVEARFSLDAMDRSYLSVYESVLGRTNGVREQPHLVPGGCA